MTTSWSLLFAAAFALGCSKPPATAAPAGGSSAESKITCHLACSGTEAQGYGATEEEARADVSRHIAENCKPEDGQYFLFCDPPSQ